MTQFSSLFPLLFLRQCLKFQRDLIEVEREESEEARLTRVTYLAAQESVSKPVTTKLIAATDEPAMVQLGDIYVCVCMSALCV